jgi:hypothetical protein
MTHFSLTCNRCGCTEITENRDYNSRANETTVTLVCTECGMEELLDDD